MELGGLPLKLACAAALAVSALVLAVAPQASSAVARRGGTGPRAPDQTVQRVYGATTSHNWAGYADTGTVFSGVVGTWVQPAATCPKAPELAAFWVGIDGFSPKDNSVEQIGTDSDCVKSSARTTDGRSATDVPSYYAWYEMFPAAAVFIPTSSNPVEAGDTMSAAVTRSGSTFTLTLIDVGKWTFSTVQTATPAPADSSAEWVVEAPSHCTARKCATASLADFGTIAFTGASANGASISSPGFSENSITMKKGHVVKAQPSPLTGGGTAFSVTWLHS